MENEQTLMQSDKKANFTTREIDKTETELLRAAFRWDEEFPRFYHESSDTWRSDAGDAAAIEFWQKACLRLYGVFDTEDVLKTLVYSEDASPAGGKVGECLIAYLSNARSFSLPVESISLALASIRDDCFKRGTFLIETWVLRQNRGLRALCNSIGFEATGLTMRKGQSHGRVLQWQQLVMRRG